MVQGTVDMAAYARYCHMVAGLVGEGLTRAFISRKLESEDIAGQVCLLPSCIAAFWSGNSIPDMDVASGRDGMAFLQEAKRV